jgi:hypothetical protein
MIQRGPARLAGPSDEHEPGEVRQHLRTCPHPDGIPANHPPAVRNEVATTDRIDGKEDRHLGSTCAAAGADTPGSATGTKADTAILTMRWYIARDGSLWGWIRRGRRAENETGSKLTRGARGDRSPEPPLAPTGRLAAVVVAAVLGGRSRFRSLSTVPPPARRDGSTPSRASPPPEFAAGRGSRPPSRFPVGAVVVSPARRSDRRSLCCATRG